MTSKVKQNYSPTSIEKLRD